MKRKKENKNSKKLEINNISQIFFSNKNSRENKIMKKFQNPVQKFVVEEKEFYSIESANEYLLKEILKDGYESIVENKEVVRTALKKLPFKKEE